MVFIESGRISLWGGGGPFLYSIHLQQALGFVLVLFRDLMQGETE